MFSSIFKSTPAVLTVRQTLPGDIAETIRSSGVTPQVLTDLAALSFQSVDEIRAFVLEVAPSLSTPESFHEVSESLARAHLDSNESNVKHLFGNETLARSFLAYEFVHHKEWAVGHIKPKGAVYSALGVVQTLALMSGTMSMPVSMPEAAFFLFKKAGFDYSSLGNDAATLRVDRPEKDAVSTNLNAVDCFIIKYFMAELDETRKEQEDRLMDDNRPDLSTYRGGRKVAVGLAVRHAIVIDTDISDAFKQALSDNNISHAAFFEGGTKKFLPEPLYSVLKAAVPSTVPGAKA